MSKTQVWHRLCSSIERPHFSTVLLRPPQEGLSKEEIDLARWCRWLFAPQEWNDNTPAKSNDEEYQRCLSFIHFFASTVPFIAGTGIYSDVRMLQTADQIGTRAGAIPNLSFLSIQAGLGLTILISKDDLSPVVRFVHRIVGIGVIASAVWLSFEGSLDRGVPSVPRYTAYIQTVLATAPLILFTF